MAFAERLSPNIPAIFLDTKPPGQAGVRGSLLTRPGSRMTPAVTLRANGRPVWPPRFSRGRGASSTLRNVNTKPLAVYLGGLALMLLTLIGVAVYQAEQSEKRRSRPEYQQRLREYLEYER